LAAGSLPERHRGQQGRRPRDGDMTGDYTIVKLQRQDELTRAIQGRMADAQEKKEENAPERSGESVDAAA
jgi:hypothetical protein